MRQRRKRMSPRGTVGVALLLLGLMACGGVSDLNSPNEEVSLWIVQSGERIDTLTMTVGESVDLDVENRLGQALPVVWSVSPSAMATVSSQGLVSAAEVGTGRVTAIYSALVTASVTLVVE